MGRLIRVDPVPGPSVTQLLREKSRVLEGGEVVALL